MVLYPLSSFIIFFYFFLFFLDVSDLARTFFFGWGGLFLFRQHMSSPSSWAPCSAPLSFLVLFPLLMPLFATPRRRYARENIWKWRNTERRAEKEEPDLCTVKPASLLLAFTFLPAIDCRSFLRPASSYSTRWMKKGHLKSISTKVWLLIGGVGREKEREKRARQRPNTEVCTNHHPFIFFASLIHS